MLIYEDCFPFSKGGGQRRLYEIGHRLANRGWKIDWLTFQNWSGPKNIKRNGINYMSLGNAPLLFNNQGSRTKRFPLIFFVSFLMRIKMLRRYDIIWIGQWPLIHLIPAIIFGKLFKKIIIIDWWEVWGKETWVNYSRSVGYVGYCIESITLYIATRLCIIITDSKLEERRIRKFNQNWKNILFAPNGLPVEEIGEVDLKKSKKYDIVYFGRLKNHKRVDLLLKAVEILKRDYYSRVKVAIIGTGPEKINLDNLSDNLGIKDQICFFGHLDNASDLYSLVKNSSLCVITTLGGGGGNLSLIEAYGCGLPVIAFDSPKGIDRDLIDHNKSGLLVKPVDSKSLADSLASLLNNPEKLNRMQSYSQKLSFNYNWDKVCDVYEKSIRSGLVC